MRIRLRLFARQREIVGARELPLELPDDSTIADAWRALVARHPDLAPGTAYVRFGRNGTYAPPDERLADGDELACIPPVAGGAGESDRVVVRDLRIVSEPIDDAALRDIEARVATTADGAVVAFVGRTRETAGTPAPGEEAAASRHAGAAVLALEYEAYDAMALGVLDQIAGEIEERFGVRRIAVLHRVGVVAVGEPSVAIAVAAPHRGVAFEACRYAIDELQARAPIWKSERFADGTVWIGAPARTGPEQSGAPARH